MPCERIESSGRGGQEPHGVIVAGDPVVCPRFIFEGESFAWRNVGAIGRRCDASRGGVALSERGQGMDGQQRGKAESDTLDETHFV